MPGEVYLRGYIWCPEVAEVRTSNVIAKSTLQGALEIAAAQLSACFDSGSAGSAV